MSTKRVVVSDYGDGPYETVTILGPEIDFSSRHQELIDKFYVGHYILHTAPPVTTVSWGVDSWLTYIDNGGGRWT